MSNREEIRSGIGLKPFLFALLSALLLMTLLIPSQLSAYAEEKGSITMSYPAPDVSFSLYYIGVSDQNGGYNLNEPYVSFDVNLTSKDAASTLAGYITSNQIEADQTTTSDEDGNVVFKDLAKGVYLILGTTAEYDGATYYSSPVMLELPYWSSDDELTWDRTIEGKYESDKDKPEPSSSKLTVRKVWKNDTEADRPKDITVQLLCDGELSDREDAEVVLNSDNSWNYCWENLDSSHTWTVNEKDVPDGYTVNKSTDGEEIVLTNTGSTPPDSDTPTSKTLPHTGQYWIPVLGLITAGLFLILIGLLRRARKSND